MSRRDQYRSLYKRKVRSLFIESLEQRLLFDAAVGSLSMSFIDKAAESDLVSSDLVARSMVEDDSFIYTKPIDSIPSNPPPALLNPVAVSDDFAQFNSIEDWRDALVQRQMVIHENSFSTRYDGYQDTFSWDPDPTDDEAPWTIARVWGDGQYPIVWRCGNDDMAMLKSSSLFAASNLDSTPVQVAGIDEGDIVETDGRYLYVMRLGKF